MQANAASRKSGRAARLGCLLLLVGCGEGVAPFDELPLRDALRADPAAIAALPEEARLRLYQRFEAARAADQHDDALEDPTAAPPAVMAALDQARAQRRAEPLVAGAVGGDGRVRPFAGPGAAGGALSSLPVEGSPATDAASALEARALSGAAGAIVTAMQANSAATNLQRVTGWPIGAVTIGDTVYVNVSWLVAMATGDVTAGGADAGAPAAVTPAGRAAPAPAVPVADGGAPSGQERRTAALSATDGGTDALRDPWPPPAPDPPPDHSADGCAASGDGCAACADANADDSNDGCATTEDDGSDPCSSAGDDGSDPCSNTQDDDAQACSNSADDAGGSCSLARGREHRRGRTSHSVLWLPLGYLLLVRRR